MSADCDLLFVNGEVIDGCGVAAQAAAVAVRGDRIVGVGDPGGWRAAEVVDLSGQTLCPGFIDVHTHDDQALLDDPDMGFKTSQGVTTVVTGNCGVSLAPLALNGGAPPAPLSEVAGAEKFVYARFADYLAALEAAPSAVNAACLVGHTTLRVGAMTALDRAATPEELATMAARCQEALDAGAIGVSSGLFYRPAMPAPAEEVVALARLAGAVGGLYTAHIRDEGDQMDAALDEAFEIARDSGARLVLSHHKVSGQANFGRSRQTLRRIAQARTRQPVGFDVYPYDAGSTMLNEASWAASRRVIVSWSQPYPGAAGRDLAEVAQELGLSEREALDALSPGGGVFFMMDEADVRRILAHPDAMIGSDGLPLQANPHPRLWGTFTRVLGRYARDEGLFSFEEAVRRMTSLPAAQFRLVDRGVIAPGAVADLVALDRAGVLDTATFERPVSASQGIHSVYVAGQAVWRGGGATGARPGRVLRRA